MMFNKRVWLNPDSSSSTGSIVCFSGLANWTEAGSDKPAKSRFVEIADCHKKVRIHQGEMDSLEEFIKKIELMKHMLTEFQMILESETGEQ